MWHHSDTHWAAVHTHPHPAHTARPCMWEGTDRSTGWYHPHTLPHSGTGYQDNHQCSPRSSCHGNLQEKGRVSVNWDTYVHYWQIKYQKYQHTVMPHQSTQGFIRLQMVYFMTKYKDLIMLLFTVKMSSCFYRTRINVIHIHPYTKHSLSCADFHHILTCPTSLRSYLPCQISPKLDNKWEMYGQKFICGAK